MSSHPCVSVCIWKIVFFSCSAKFRVLERKVDSFLPESFCVFLWGLGFKEMIFQMAFCVVDPFCEHGQRCIKSPPLLTWLYCMMCKLFKPVDPKVLIDIDITFLLQQFNHMNSIVHQILNQKRREIFESCILLQHCMSDSNSFIVLFLFQVLWQ